MASPRQSIPGANMVSGSLGGAGLTTRFSNLPPGVAIIPAPSGVPPASSGPSLSGQLPFLPGGVSGLMPEGSGASGSLLQVGIQPPPVSVGGRVSAPRLSGPQVALQSDAAAFLTGSAGIPGSSASSMTATGRGASPMAGAGAGGGSFTVQAPNSPGIQSVTPRSDSITGGYPMLSRPHSISMPPARSSGSGAMSAAANAAVMGTSPQGGGMMYPVGSTTMPSGRASPPPGAASSQLLSGGPTLGFGGVQPLSALPPSLAPGGFDRQSLVGSGSGAATPGSRGSLPVLTANLLQQQVNSLIRQQSILQAQQSGSATSSGPLMGSAMSLGGPSMSAQVRLWQEVMYLWPIAYPVFMFITS
jgi:hypothetical protein